MLLHWWNALDGAGLGQIHRSTCSGWVCCHHCCILPHCNHPIIRRRVWEAVNMVHGSVASSARTYSRASLYLIATCRSFPGSRPLSRRPQLLAITVLQPNFTHCVATEILPAKLLTRLVRPYCAAHNHSQLSTSQQGHKDKRSAQQGCRCSEAPTRAHHFAPGHAHSLPVDSLSFCLCVSL